MSPALAVGFFTTEPPGKPKNTGVGSLSLPQGIFLTQELKRGLLHFRRILYQLSYQEREYQRTFLGKMLSVWQLCSVGTKELLNFSS